MYVAESIQIQTTESQNKLSIKAIPTNKNRVILIMIDRTLQSVDLILTGI